MSARVAFLLLFLAVAWVPPREALAGIEALPSDSKPTAPTARPKSADSDALPLDDEKPPAAPEKPAAGSHRAAEVTPEALPLDDEPLPSADPKADGGSAEEKLPSAPPALMEDLNRTAAGLFIESQNLRAFLRRAGLRVQPSVVFDIRNASGWESEYLVRLQSGCGRNRIEFCLEGELNYFKDQALELSHVAARSRPWMDAEWVSSLTAQFQTTTVAGYNGVAASVVLVTLLQRSYRAGYEARDKDERAAKPVVDELISRLNNLAKLSGRAWRSLSRLHKTLPLVPMEPWTRAELPERVELVVDSEAELELPVLPYFFRNAWHYGSLPAVKAAR